MRMKRTITCMVLSITMVLTGWTSVFATNNNDSNINTGGDVQGTQGQVESAEEMLSGREYADNQLIVTFENETKNSVIRSEVEEEDGECGSIVTSKDEGKIVQVETSEDISMETAIENFQENPRVVSVQPNYKYKVCEGNDPLLEEDRGPYYQYQFSSTNAQKAWSLVEDGEYSTTKVAVLDTGVDANHEDLQSTMVTPGKYTQIVDGTIDENVQYDTGNHGTHVSGIVGATYNNAKGGAGIASGHNNDLVDLMVVGISEDGENMYTADIVAGIDYAVSKGAKVINMSFGGAGKDRVLEETIVQATQEDGVVFVAASGNESTDEYCNPSDFKDVISVNAINSGENFASTYSNYGMAKDISAPGSNINSTMPGNKYDVNSGTSMASPVVAGVAALVLDVNPTLTPAQVYNILCATTKTKGFSKDNFAFGIVDAEKAVTAAKGASESISVEEVFLKESQIELEVNDNYGLESLIYPATSLKEVSWKSANPEIAKVDENGNVIGISAGKTTVTVTADGLSKSCVVTVTEGVPATKIAINGKKTYEYMKEGEEGQLSCTITPNNATIQEVYWTSDNPDVVRVNEYGAIMAKSVGTSLITAKTFDGRVTDSFTINVKEPITGIRLTKKTTEIRMGTTFDFDAEFYGESGITSEQLKPDTVYWDSNNTDIATIDHETGVVTPRAVGTVNIVAYAKSTLQDEVPVKTYIRIQVAKSNYSGSDYGLQKTAVSYNSATLKWKAIPMASTYLIQRATSATGTYKTIATVSKSTLSYKNIGLTTGKTYYYKVKAQYAENGTSKYFSNSSVVSAKTYLSKPSVSTSLYGRRITVRWNKISGASGYVVYKASSKYGTYSAIKTIRSSSTVKHTTGILKRGKTYYYKVRAYKYVNGVRVYSSYSNIGYRRVR